MERFEIYISINKIIKNQHRFILTPYLRSVEKNEISSDANLSSSFAHKKRFAS